MKVYTITIACRGTNNALENRRWNQICRDWNEALQLVQDWIQVFGVIVEAVAIHPAEKQAAYLMPTVGEEKP